MLYSVHNQHCVCACVCCLNTFNIVRVRVCVVGVLYTCTQRLQAGVLVCAHARALAHTHACTRKRARTCAPPPSEYKKDCMYRCVCTCTCTCTHAHTGTVLPGTDMRSWQEKSGLPAGDDGAKVRTHTLSHTPPHTRTHTHKYIAQICHTHTHTHTHMHCTYVTHSLAHSPRDRRRHRRRRPPQRRGRHRLRLHRRHLSTSRLSSSVSSWNKSNLAGVQLQQPVLPLPVPWPAVIEKAGTGRPTRSAAGRVRQVWEESMA